MALRYAPVHRQVACCGFSARPIPGVDPAAIEGTEPIQSGDQDPQAVHSCLRACGAGVGLANLAGFGTLCVLGLVGLRYTRSRH